MALSILANCNFGEGMRINLNTFLQRIEAAETKTFQTCGLQPPQFKN